MMNNKNFQDAIKDNIETAYKFGRSAGAHKACAPDTAKAVVDLVQPCDVEALYKEGLEAAMTDTTYNSSMSAWNKAGWNANYATGYLAGFVSSLTKNGDDWDSPAFFESILGEEEE